MVISSPNFSSRESSAMLTPALIRGLYLIWRSDLQSGQGAEIRELDCNNAFAAFSAGASGGDPGIAPNIESPRLSVSGEMICAALNQGHKILLCGNGGSAADAQHIAAELVGRYELQRRAWPSIALTTDTSALTALSNDFGYDEVFARQVQALASEGDVLIALSTSGASAKCDQGRGDGQKAATAGQLRSLAEPANLLPHSATCQSAFLPSEPHAYKKHI